MKEFMNRKEPGMTEEDVMLLELNSIKHILSFFEVVLNTLPDHFDMSIYKDDFPFA